MSTPVATIPATTMPAATKTPGATMTPGVTTPGATKTPAATPSYVPLSMYNGYVTPNPNAMDAAGLMNVLNHYLVNSPLIHNNIGDYNNVDQQIDTINTQLNSISNVLDTNSAANILAQQDNVNHIVNSEMQRLNSKQQSIDSAMTTQRRMLQMNDSYLKRQRVYMRITVAIVIALVVLILCKVLSGYSDDEGNTDVILSMISILVIVAVVIYCGWALVMLWRRDPMYYDQLHYIPDEAPISLQGNTGLQVGQIVSAAGAANPNLNACIGSGCCSAAQGTVWDPYNNACVKESFVPKSMAVVPPSLQVVAPNGANTTPYDADNHIYASATY